MAPGGGQAELGPARPADEHGSCSACQVPLAIPLLPGRAPEHVEFQVSGPSLVLPLYAYIWKNYFSPHQGFISLFDLTRTCCPCVWSCTCVLDHD